MISLEHEATVGCGGPQHEEQREERGYTGDGCEPDEQQRHLPLTAGQHVSADCAELECDVALAGGDEDDAE
jgi:hypothetical protein